jgi:DNA polymerase elongation subunit (family B)
MVTKLTNFISPDMSDAGRRNSRLHTVQWTLDDETNRFFAPVWNEMEVLQRIPTPLRKDHDEQLLKRSVDKYKKNIIQTYTIRSDELNETLAKSRTNTKKYERLTTEIKDIEQFLSRLDETISLEGPFRPTQGSSYAAYHVITPPVGTDLKRYLPSSLFIHDVGYSKQLSFESVIPFTLTEENHKHPNETFHGHQEPSLELLVQQPGFAIDFETHNWMHEPIAESYGAYSDTELQQTVLELSKSIDSAITEEDLIWYDRKQLLQTIETYVNQENQERLTAAVFCNLEQNANYLVTTLETGLQSMEIDIPGTTEKVTFELITTEDQDQLIEEVNNLFEFHQPFFVYGNYQMTFDYGKAEELTKNFRPGVGRTKPSFVSQIPGGFIKQRILPGRCDIDIALYAQNCMPTFNNKLDTVYHHLFGVPAKKTESYTDLFEKTDRAEAGDKKAAMDILYYTGQDGIKSYFEGEALKKEHTIKAQLFSSLPARIDATGRKQLTEDFFTRAYWKTKHTVPRPAIRSRRRGTTEFSDFSGLDFLYSSIDVNKPKQGLQKGTLVALHPFFYAFRPLLERDPVFERYYAQVQNESDSRTRARLLFEAESLAEYPLFMHLVTQPKRFNAEFSLPFEGVGSYEWYTNRIERSIEYMQRLSDECGLINWNGQYALFSEDFDEELLKKFEDEHMMSSYGKGLFLSGTQGRFSGSIDGELYMRGIADFHSNKGERCPFEKSFYQAFLDTLLVQNDLTGSIHIVDTYAKRLQEGSVSVDEITYSRKAKRNHMDYSSAATQPYISIMQEQEVLRGELFSYTYNHHKMQQKFFGLGMQKKGTMSVLVDWLFEPIADTSLKDTLQSLYSGTATEQETKRLSETLGDHYAGLV